MAAFLLWPFFCEGTERKRALISLSHVGLGLQSYRIRAPLLWSHFSLITSLESLFPNIVTWGFKASTYEFGKGKNTIQFIRASFYQIFFLERNEIPLFQALLWPTLQHHFHHLYPLYVTPNFQVVYLLE